MKLRVLHRNSDLYTKSQVGQQRLKYGIQGTSATPLAQAVQHQRAVNAVKIDKIFAKPLVHQFSGHIDSVSAISRCNQSIFDFFSGSSDGEIRFWNAGQKKCWRSVARAHEGIIEGLCVAADDKYLFSCSRDQKVKQWAVEKYYDVLNQDEKITMDAGNLVYEHQDYVQSALEKEISPVQLFQATSPLTSVDHRLEMNQILATGSKVWIWDQNRTSILQEMEWGNDGFYSARWSPSETHVFAATSGDNSVTLFDTRQNEGVQRVVLEMRSNAASWNPQKPFQFVVANEDSNVYAFDIRNMSQAFRIHYGFVNAVLDVDYSPTGQHLVGAGFDRTIRIWSEGESRSRQLYHAERMQIVLTTRFSGDGKYVYSGSADMNIRVWKTNASEVLGPKSRKEELKIQEREALKEKFKEAPQVKRMARHQPTPAYIKSRTKKRVIMTEAQKKREERRLRHGMPSEQKMYKETMVRTPAEIPSSHKSRSQKNLERSVDSNRNEPEPHTTQLEEEQELNGNQ